MDLSKLSGDKLGLLQKYLTGFPVDKFGYMWSTGYKLESSGATIDIHNAFGQGWPIPNYTHSDGKALGYEFSDEGASGWTTNGTSKINGGLFESLATTNNLWFESPSIQLDTEQAPFIRLDVRVLDMDHYEEINNIEDIYICWQTNEGGDTWYEVSQKEFSTIPEKDIGSFFGRNMFYPMYLHADWNGKTVKKVRIEIRTTDQKQLYLKGSLHYARFDYDTRQSNNNTIFLCYANEYFKFNNDKERMEDVLTTCRRMMTFLLNHLKGNTGLLNIGYFAGHDGLGMTPGHGLGNGYWDIFAAPSINLDANTYFYKALLAMAEMEERATAYGLNIDKAEATIAGLDGYGTIAYQEDASSLRALAQTVKTRMQEYFWNADTGRLHYGFVNDGSGDRKIDYGYVQFNLEAITAGIPTEAQEQSIMSWINGDRVVESDLDTTDVATDKASIADFTQRKANAEQQLKTETNASTIKTLNNTIKKATDNINRLQKKLDQRSDLYYYRFGPRSTTKKNFTDYEWLWLGGDWQFGNQVQDGGAILYVTYYDLISRRNVLGANNAFARVKEIQDWYEDVKAAGGRGKEFYRWYYINEGIEMQGNGQHGAVGIDREFLESCMLYDYISDGIINFNAEKAYELSIAPTLPDGLTYFNAYNLYYDGIVYDLQITQDTVKITNVRGKTAGKKITLSWANKKQTFDFGECQL